MCVNSVHFQRLFRAIRNSNMKDHLSLHGIKLLLDVSHRKQSNPECLGV